MSFPTCSPRWSMRTGGDYSIATIDPKPLQSIVKGLAEIAENAEIRGEVYFLHERRIPSGGAD